MSGATVTLQQLTRVTPLAIRFWDEAAARVVSDGLVVEVYPRDARERRVAAHPNRIGVFVVPRLPGPRDPAFEFGAGDAAFWQRIEPRPHTIEVHRSRRSFPAVHARAAAARQGARRARVFAAAVTASRRGAALFHSEPAGPDGHGGSSRRAAHGGAARGGGGAAGARIVGRARSTRRRTAAGPRDRRSRRPRRRDLSLSGADREPRASDVTAVRGGPVAVGPGMDRAARRVLRPGGAGAASCRISVARSISRRPWCGRGRPVPARCPISRCATDRN